METFLKELPALIVTLALIALAAVLLLMGKMSSTDPVIDTFMTTVVAYWFLHGAYQWQPTPPTTLPPPPAQSSAPDTISRS